MPARTILDRVARRYRRLAPQGASVLAAVSGGGDSTALLFMLHELKKRCAIKRLGVLHVNHGLRGSESDADETFVASLAQRLKAPFHVKRLKGRSLRTREWKSGRAASGMVSSRKSRRRKGMTALQRAIRRTTRPRRSLFRIMRGTGLRGLRGVSCTARGQGHQADYQLPQGRTAFLAFVTGNPVRHDSSNDDCAFGRNRIRLQILPALEQQEPGAARRLRRSRKKPQNWARHSPQSNDGFPPMSRNPTAGLS